MDIVGTPENTIYFRIHLVRQQILALQAVERDLVTELMMSKHKEELEVMAANYVMIHPHSKIEAIKEFRAYTRDLGGIALGLRICKQFIDEAIERRDKV